MYIGRIQVEWKYYSTEFQTSATTDVSDQTVCTGLFTAREIALVFIELDAGWALELVWMFWRGHRSLAAARI